MFTKLTCIVRIFPFNVHCKFAFFAYLFAQK